MSTLYIIRGLPGSGKTTLAHKIADVVFEADDHFTNKITGVYSFDPSMLREAHGECFRRASEAMAQGVDVAVANTFSRQWEWDAYTIEAARRRVHVVVIDLFNAGLTDEQLCARCVHGVPLHTIRNMRNRWER